MDTFPGPARNGAEGGYHGTVLVENAKRIKDGNKIPENCHSFEKRCGIRILRMRSCLT